MSQKLVQKDEGFLIAGVIPNPSSPSDALLRLECNITGIFTERGSDYMAWKQKLEDLINKKDAKYARVKSRLKGRGVDVKYRTFQAKEATGKVDAKGKPVFKKVIQRVRVLELMPYPSVFASRLSFSRQKFYRAIQSNGGIILNSSSVGKLKHNTYFLLSHQAAGLTNDTDKLNAEIEKLNQDVENFEKTKDFADMIGYLKRDIPVERWSKRPPIHSHIHPISLGFQPMPISKWLIEQYTDKSVMDEVRNNIHQQVEKITGTVTKKMSEWVHDLSIILLRDLTVGDIFLAEKKLTEIKQMAEEYQIAELVSKDMELCETLFNAIKTKDAVMIDKATKEVAKAAGIDTSGKGTRAILSEASLNMNEVSEQAKALIKGML